MKLLTVTSNKARSWNGEAGRTRTHGQKTCRKGTRGTSKCELRCRARKRCANSQGPRPFGVAESTGRYRNRQAWRTFAETGPVEPNPEVTPEETPPPGPEFIPVCYVDDVPKGTRKQVDVDGKPVLLLWYRSELRAIEARSTAEGYYTEGFMNAKFTQDYGIICPMTETVFSIKDGSIMEWYPTNPVLRKLTPQETCRPIEIYDVQVSGDSVYVDPTGSLKDWEPPSGIRADFTMPGEGPSSKGGADTSVEGNNVYGIEPKMYLQGTDVGTPLEEAPEAAFVSGLSPATIIVGTIGIGIVSVAGTGLCLFYENFIALGIFWAVGISVVGYFAQKYNFSSGNQ